MNNIINNINNNNNALEAISFHELFGPIGIGFGTAGIRGHTTTVIEMAIENGFRKFDTAEENMHWYDQSAVGMTLELMFAESFEEIKSNLLKENMEDEKVDLMTNIKSYFSPSSDQDEASSTRTLKNQQHCEVNELGEEECTPLLKPSCWDEKLQISTKIPPWELTSVQNIRARALESREQLLGFCDDIQVPIMDPNPNNSHLQSVPYPLDVYYIHIPRCYDGWHPECNGVQPTDILSLRDAWTAMEAVVAEDYAATRIGLSNVDENELMDIIHFVQKRQHEFEQQFHDHNVRNRNVHYYHPTPPRMPDVVQNFADPLHPQNKIRAICEEYNIEFVSYSTLGTQHRGSKNPVLTHPTIMSLAGKHNRSTAEVVLSWAMSNNMSVIPRSNNKAHIEQLARLLDPKAAFFLDNDDLDRIDAMALN